MNLGRYEKRKIRQLYKMGKEKRTEILQNRLTDYYIALDMSFIDGSIAYKDELLEYEAKLFDIKPDYDKIEKNVLQACI